MPRAHGRIIDGAGNGVPGKVYFYRTLDHEPTDWRAMTDGDGRPASTTVFGRPLIWTGQVADAVPDADRRGYFDVPGGLPIGTYYIDVHAGGMQRWAWPFRVTSDGVPMDVRLGGPSAGVPGGQPRVVAVFGDSDSSERGPIGARSTDIAKELTGPGIVAVNRAEGATPIHGYMTEGDDPRKRNGVEQVERACREMGVIDVAVLRFGLNDAHQGDMNPPTTAGIESVRFNYGRALDLLRAKGTKQVVLCEIILEADKRADRVAANQAINGVIRDLAKARGCILVSPGIDARNDVNDYVWTDGIHLNDRGTRYVAGLIREAIGAVAEPPGPAPAPTDVAKHFTPGTFTASVSLYGLLGAPLDRAKRDLSRFRAAGFGNARVWIDWGSLDKYPQPASAVFDRDGNFIEDVARKLDELLLYGLTIGMSFDLTMHSSHYKATKVSGEGYDITEHKRAVRLALQRWGQQATFRILDMANEAEQRGPGNHGSPDTGHVSPGRFKELMDVARSVPRKCLVSVSASEDGNPYHPDYDNGYLFRDTKGEILLPHFARVGGWGANEGPKGKKLMALQPGIPCHCQEPARNNYNGQNWPVSEFENSFRSAKANGLVGMCFHTGAGFDMTQRDAWDQLDSVEQQVVANLKGWIA